ncbi:pectinesterase [Neltuma alba]|uniref:pectinesterase n=1 Tax=Neltuma alba TaxID=207710 RepID=UPI0010A3CF3E|nr:pectinesterase [Prosopis alba]
MAAASAVLLLLLVLLSASAISTVFCRREMELLGMAQTHVLEARTWAESHPQGGGGIASPMLSSRAALLPAAGVALRDCAKLYEESEQRLNQLALLKEGDQEDGYEREDDAVTWVSGVMSNHRTCLDGLEEKGYDVGTQGLHKNLTLLLGETLHLFAKNKHKAKAKAKPKSKSTTKGKHIEVIRGLLASWNPTESKAHFAVAQDGSGSHTTIGAAIEAVSSMGHNRPERVIIHVKSGVYNEKVEIGYKLKNLMLVGDGIGKTIITGARSVRHGSSTVGSATFDVSGDGFWGRDMTIENRAGPQDHQAVAMKVSSDLSVFYRCSFRGYQDTLYVHSNRQFYRDSIISGTVDFIFGDASVVFQNCDILLQQPASHQSIFITAQGRDDPNQPTGIVIQNCKVRPASGSAGAKNYLGRPWKKYSRTVFMKNDLDGCIDPKGWSEWDGGFALSTLYYAEYMNNGAGASTQNRVKWPGFHVLLSTSEVMPFSVNEFLGGGRWIPATGVPFSAGV